MTENQWDKLKSGDQIVNKRSPGIPLTVTDIQHGLDHDGKPNDHIEAVLLHASHGAFWVRHKRYLEFQLLLPNERLSL